MRYSPNSLFSLIQPGKIHHGCILLSNIHFYSCNICPDILNRTARSSMCCGLKMQKFQLYCLNSELEIQLQGCGWSTGIIVYQTLAPKMLVCTALLCVTFPWAFPWVRTYPFCPLVLRISPFKRTEHLSSFPLSDWLLLLF